MSRFGKLFCSAALLVAGACSPPQETPPSTERPPSQGSQPTNRFRIYSALPPVVNDARAKLMATLMEDPDCAHPKIEYATDPGTADLLAMDCETK